MITTFKIVTLCGSTKFKSAFLEWAARLMLEESALVFSVGLFGHTDQVELSRYDKARVDIIHFAKIEASHEIFVLDLDGYIGESTEREVVFAEALGRKVRYLSKEHPKWTEDDCVYCKPGGA